MTEDMRAVLKEFHGNRAAMAGEILRLRARLEDALYEISRLAAGRERPASVLFPTAAPPIRPAQPFGFRSSRSARPAPNRS